MSLPLLHTCLLARTPLSTPQKFLRQGEIRCDTLYEYCTEPTLRYCEGYWPCQYSRTILQLAGTMWNEWYPSIQQINPIQTLKIELLTGPVILLAFMFDAAQGVLARKIQDTISQTLHHCAWTFFPCRLVVDLHIAMGNWSYWTKEWLL